MFDHLKSLLVLVVLCVSLPTLAQKNEAEHLFQEPPTSARPWVLWMWMNGNVSADGITRDLEAMKRVGIGGALIFNPGEFIPRGPVDYGGKEWRDLMVLATQEASRLGLELAMHNCPGWSSSGGPWITPEKSMQQLVWSETKIIGGQKQALTLSQPTTRLDYYRDICVLAFPSQPGEERPFSELLSEVVTGRGTNVDRSVLTDWDWNTGAQAGPDEPIVLKFAEPYEARSVSVVYRSGGASQSYTLEAGNDGEHYRPVTRLVPSNSRAIEDAPTTESFDAVKATHFRIVPSRRREILEVQLNAAPRIAGWHYKADFTLRSAQYADRPAEVAKEFAIDPATIVDLTGKMDAQGRLTWEAPAGAWTILRFGFTPRGQNNIAAPDAGVGLECDKLSKAGVEFHFEKGLKPLLKELGPLTGKAFTRLEVDSYEVGLQNWTAGFEGVFKQRNGYDLLRYLPAMTGRFVGSADVSERFLWDLRHTLGVLVAENYYEHFRELCHEQGLKLHVEPYGAGPGPYDEIRVAGEGDVPMGEFWSRFPWDDTPSVKLAASAAHTHGLSVVGAEAFTAEPEQSRWLEYPYALKPLGDFAFSLGANLFMFHRSAHQPNPTAMPGMTMGPWGIHFERTLTWFEQSRGWLDYLTRCQLLLRQGYFVADVLYFTGEGSPQLSKLLQPKLPEGYTFDAVDTETLLQARMDNGRIMLPSGANYRLLMLPPDLKNMTPELLRRLRELVGQGMIMVGPRPEFSPSLRNYPNNDAEIRRLADQVWSKDNRLVFTNQPVGEVLKKAKIQPDFEYTGRPDASLVWLHRRLGNINGYFVANRQRRSEDVVCTFRVMGMEPELWHPDTGRIEAAAVYHFEDGRVQVPLHLDPGGSVFVIFRKVMDRKPIRWLAKDDKKIIEAEPAVVKPNVAVTNTFSLAVWVKPDTNMRTLPRESTDGRVDESGKGYVVPAGEGDTIFGPGHVVAGLAVGRNGVFVIERASDQAPAVLVDRTPLAGWTHLAVVYRDGTPSLYVNGKLAREGLKSGKTVHPGVALKPVGRRLVYYFEGDTTPVEFWPEAISAEKIAGLAAKGLPAPEGPPPVELVRNFRGQIEATVWEPGNYALEGRRPVKVEGVLGPKELSGPWRVGFPPNLGAPVSIVLPELKSLREHDDPGVRHFSGTATYTKEFMVTKDSRGWGKKLYLDLGRVEVTAQVKVNGRDLGILWKPPYRVDITDAARVGTNQLEVQVANLWVNRLIGDEALPVENEYNARTHAIEKLPEWYVKGQPKPAGGRTTFTTWQFYGADDPLVESGLLGPVRLWNPQKKVLGLWGSKGPTSVMGVRSLVVDEQ